MTTILTCTDGSLYSTSVYDHTAWAALRMKASVHVLHMLDPHRERAALSNYSGNLGANESDALMNELVQFEESKARVAQARRQSDSPGRAQAYSRRPREPRDDRAETRFPN